MAAYFEWDIIIFRPSRKIVVLRRMPIFLPISILLIYISNQIALNQNYMSVFDVRTSLTILSITTILVINQVWDQIYYALPEKLVHGSIDSSGITFGSQKISFDSLKKSGSLEKIKKLMLPIEQWNQSRPEDGKYLELKLESESTAITLKFAEEYTRQEFLKKLTTMLI